MDASITEQTAITETQPTVKAESVTYKDVSPRDYVVENYPESDPRENRETQGILTRLHSIFSRYQKPAEFVSVNAIDVGAGPTVYQYISERNVVDRITVTDYNPSWLDVTKEWVERKPDAISWDSYFSNVLTKEEGSEPTSAEINSAKEELRSKIHDIQTLDILHKETWPAGLESSFEIGTMHYCAESITDNKTDFMTAMINFSSLIRPGGTAVMSFLKNAPFYEAEGKVLPAFPVNEEYVKRVLENLDFHSIDIEVVSPDKRIGSDGEEGDYGPYEGDIIVSAIKSKSG